jgi:ParB-like chromosome segregation protein Spo0J
MATINETYEEVSLGALKSHPKNPRQGDVGAIYESIDANGFYGAVVAQKSTGHILAGNHRWMAAKEAGMVTVPVIWVDVDDDRALRILLADNKTNDDASYDESALAAILADLANTSDLLGTGYDGDDLDELIGSLGGKPSKEAPEAQIDRAEELREKWGVERGQLWQVGRHRILCGDSLAPTDEARLMNGQSAAMLWSDPPYGLGGYAGRSGKFTAVQGDDAAVSVLLTFYQAGAPASERYVWSEFKTYPILVEALGTPRSLIVWAKNSFGMGNGYRRQHEFLAYYGDYTGTTESDLWSEARDTNYQHPTQKPPTLASRAICNSTSLGDVVMCPYGGSGDCFVACEQTDRTCYGMEIEPKYVAVTLERLSDMGLEPRLIDG